MHVYIYSYDGLIDANRNGERVEGLRVPAFYFGEGDWERIIDVMAVMGFNPLPSSIVCSIPYDGTLAVFDPLIGGIMKLRGFGGLVY